MVHAIPLLSLDSFLHFFSGMQRGVPIVCEEEEESPGEKA